MFKSILEKKNSQRKKSKTQLVDIIRHLRFVWPRCLEKVNQKSSLKFVVKNCDKSHGTIGKKITLKANPRNVEICGGIFVVDFC